MGTRISVAGGAGAALQADSVHRVVFGFCSGELYRIVVSYDPDETEGLTDQDLVEALSAAYGTASKPVAKIITSSASMRYTDVEPVAARWEDARASVNLFHRSYGVSVGLVIFSKTMAPIARAAIEKGLRLDELGAPRREIAEQKTRDDAEKLVHAKSRVVNKRVFRF